MLGSNIKVHFAGIDSNPFFYISTKCANVHYTLYSVYGYINKKEKDSNFALPDNHIVKLNVMNNNHVIQDSGLFTLMFGKDKGKVQTRESLTEWQDKLIEFVKQNHLSATCVEIDCQKVLSVEDAWYFRERMRKLLPNRQINVFHMEDGKEGLDRLIDFSHYIAISVPEIRIIKRAKAREEVHKLAWYIKNKKPEIDIHLLGCTEYKMLADNTFCTSADSTTWLQGVKYGYEKDLVRKAKFHVNNYRKDLFDERRKKCMDEMKSIGLTATEKGYDYIANASLTASSKKKLYENVAGNQE